MQDPYKTLGVDRDASAEQVKGAYRKLAKQLHPDLNPGDTKVEQHFKDVSHAYSILGDAKKRKRYDRGEIDASGQDRGPRGGGGFYRRYAESGEGAKYNPFGSGGAHGLDDLFADLFGAAQKTRQTRRGQAGGRSVRRRGANVTYKLSVGFLDAATGAKKRIQLADGKTLDVNIPPGTEQAQQLRLKGQGMAGLGGAAAGDALIEINIEPHRLFTRKGLDITIELPISLHEAVAGGSVQVPTVHGKVAMKIPPGTNSGATLRLKGKGIKGPKGGEAGNQYVTVTVVLPDSPDQEFRDFIERWSKDHPYDPRRGPRRDSDTG